MRCKLSKTIEAVNPCCVISGAIAQNSVVRQVLAQPHHDRAKIDAARLLGRHLGPREILRVSHVRPLAPGNAIGWPYGLQRRGKCGWTRVERQMRAIELPKLLGARMNVDQLHLRRRNAEQRVALRGELAQPSTDKENKIGFLDPRNEFGIGADAKVARITGIERIEQR